MIDRLEKIGKSLIQHGKVNDRVYIMKLNSENFQEVIDKSEELCKIEAYTKIFAKVPKIFYEKLSKIDYIKEAEIPKFYEGEKDCVFLAKYFDENRSILNDKVEIEEILSITNSLIKKNVISKLSDDYKIRDMEESDAKEMARIYKEVFNSYPFPVFDKDYLIQTMRENVEYSGIWYKNQLVSVASAEKYPEYLNAEMTDFATLPKFRGNNFSYVLLKYMEEKMIKKGYKCLYTIARAKSPAMNITFKKADYIYSGTLTNNTNISGGIESMNVWYKNV